MNATCNTTLNQLAVLPTSNVRAALFIWLQRHNAQQALSLSTKVALAFRRQALAVVCQTLLAAGRKTGDATCSEKLFLATNANKLHTAHRFACAEAIALAVCNSVLPLPDTPLVGN